MQQLNTELATGDLAALDAPGLPVADDPMPTLIYTSISAKALVTKEEAKQAGLDVSRLGGHWADVFYPKSFGSKLWLLVREQNTPETWAKAKSYCDDALAHLIGKYAASITVATGYKGINKMYIEVSYERPDGSRNTVEEVFSFAS